MEAKGSGPGPGPGCPEAPRAAAVTADEGVAVEDPLNGSTAGTNGVVANGSAAGPRGWGTAKRSVETAALGEGLNGSEEEGAAAMGEAKGSVDTAGGENAGLGAEKNVSVEVVSVEVVAAEADAPPNPNKSGAACGGD